MLEPQHYKGRSQALVKHTFLKHYLPALINKTCSRWGGFVYVDGFAGPWQSADEVSYSDTSFGIALKSMSDARAHWAQRQDPPHMVAHLVEKDDDAFEKLRRLKEQFPSIDIRLYHGPFESHLNAILAALPRQAFCFSFIDPKGVSLDLDVLQPLLARPSSEVLVNFMFDFVNRFVSHPNPAVLETMNRLIPGAAWRDNLDVARAEGASPEEREAILVDAFGHALRKAGQFNFVTSLVVQKPLSDRTLYHLVYGTRDQRGLSVFRDSQIKALEAQAAIRASEKAAARTSRSGQPDFFGGSDAVCTDPSSKEIEIGRRDGVAAALAAIDARRESIAWSALWPMILEHHTVRESELGRAMNEARRAGRIQAPDWPSDRHSKPRPEQLFMPSK